MGLFNASNALTEKWREGVVWSGRVVKACLGRRLSRLVFGPVPPVEEQIEVPPPLDGSQLSFFDNFRVVSGVPVFVLSLDGSDGRAKLGKLSQTSDRNSRLGTPAASTVGESAAPDDPTGERDLWQSLRELWQKAPEGIGFDVSEDGEAMGSRSPQLSRDSSEYPSKSSQLPGRLGMIAEILAQERAAALRDHRPWRWDDPQPSDSDDGPRGCITCCRFSSDGTRLMTGHSDGTVRVFDADHGRQVAVQLSVHSDEVADCCFAAGTDKNSEIMLSVDRAGHYVAWSRLKDSKIAGLKETTKRDKLGSYWDEPKYESAEMQLPKFQEDGSRLVCPVKAWDTSSDTLGCVLFIFDVHTSSNLPLLKSELFLAFSYSPNAYIAYDIAECLFSPTGQGLMVGVHGRNEEENILVVWPDYQEQQEDSYRLEGTFGAWSQDDALVVTWYSPVDDNFMETDGACAVWDITKMTTARLPLERDVKVSLEGSSQRVSEVKKAHPRFSAGYEILKDPLGRNIEWCSFLSRDMLLTCTTVDGVEVTVWDTRNVSRLTAWHVLDTKLSSRDQGGQGTRLANGRAWEGKWGRREPSWGLHPFSLAKGGHWLGFYSAQGNAGWIWDAEKGVEFLRFSLPPDLLQGNQGGADLMLAKNASKFAVCGAGQVLIFDPRALDGGMLRGVTRTYLDNQFECDVAHDLSLKAEGTRKGTSPKQNALCHFSQDGDKVGLLYSPSERMHMWDLGSGMRYEVVCREDDEGDTRNFSDFCFASMGDLARFATCMADGSVYLWRLVDDKQDGCAKWLRKIGQLTPAKSPILALCFSKKPIVPSRDPTKEEETVVACEKRGKLVWLDPATGSTIASVQTGPSTPAVNFKCRFSADGSKAAVFIGGQEVVIYNLVSGEILRGPHRYEPGVGPPNISFAGENAVMGLGNDPDLDPEHPNRFVQCKPQMDDPAVASTVWRTPDNLVLSDKGEWVVVAGDFREDTPFGRHRPAPRERSKRAALGSELYAPVNRIRVMHVEDAQPVKELEGLSLHPSVTAVSCEGRRVASVAGGSNLVVWTPYATRNCIPDYNYFLMDGKQPTQEEVEGLLAKHGPSVLNYPDHKGMSIVLHCVDNANTELLHWMLDWAQKHGVKVQLEMTFGMEHHWKRNKVPKNGLYLAVQRRSPGCVRVILKNLLRGLTTEYALSAMFRDSLVKLARVYPSLFYRVLKKDKFLREVGKLQAPEALLRKKKFLVMTDDRLLADHPRPNKQALADMWRFEEKINEHRLYNSKPTPAVAKVIPYADIAKIGSKGILRNLLIADVDHHAFATLPMMCVIKYKWSAYGRQLLLEEIWHYSVMLIFFVVYCFLLGYQPSFDDTSDVFTGGRSQAALVFLFLSVAMAALSLVRDARQLKTYWEDSRLKGLQYWISSPWNWLELASYIFLVFVIPAMHLTADSRHSSTQLSNVVAVEVILISIRLLYYAQAFEHTAPMVIMIREIVKDIRFFLFLGFAVLFGFGFAFFVLYRHERNGEGVSGEETDEAIDTQFGNIGRSMITMFGMMLGEFDFDVLYAPRNAEVSIALFIVYMGVMMIILLNLLIAIMGDSYSNIKDSENAHFMKARAEAIDDVESMMSTDRRRKIDEGIGQYLHVLVPRHPRGRLPELEGQGRAMEKRFRRVMKGGLRKTQQILKKALAGQKKLHREFRSVVGIQGGRQKTMKRPKSEGALWLLGRRTSTKAGLDDLYDYDSTEVQPLSRRSSVSSSSSSSSASATPSYSLTSSSSNSSGIGSDDGDNED
eukprot:evm.model.scf_2069.1 EVM.evm.TU.scf_2069.1   scf_2069:9780-19707(+)